jgi:peptidoglycan/LPS O-acetylase OafA/YrhL
VVLNLLVVATLTIALSTVTYRYVEAPAIRRKSLMVDHRTSRRVIAAQVATGEAAP